MQITESAWKLEKQQLQQQLIKEEREVLNMKLHSEFGGKLRKKK